MSDKLLRLGVIGYGFRARHMLSVMKDISKIEIAAICDTNINAAREYAQQCEPNHRSIEFYEDYVRMAGRGGFDGIVLGTNCSSHTPIAMEVIRQGLPLFLEKPVSINREQLNELIAISRLKTHKVVVSFPLRFTPLLKTVKRIIDSGRIGTVEHVQAYNNVPYGHVYFQSWYRNYDETGGLFLQKATHDFDYLNYLIGQSPVQIAAMTSKNVFMGNQPIGLYCRDCEKRLSCNESPYNPRCLAAESEWMKPEQYMCSFAPDAANEDCGSALIRYESGMHSTYSQNFFVKHKAAMRGARLMGYDGTIEFDWYANSGSVFMHHTGDREEFTADASIFKGHGGGDHVLAENFIDVIKGTADSASTLEDGILSALMCLCARESAAEGCFKKILYEQSPLEK